MKMLLLTLVILALFACQSDDNSGVITSENQIQIKLNGPITDASNELSGMAWFGDTLILLSQYPGSVSDLSGKYSAPDSSRTAWLYGISRSTLDSAVLHDSPVTPFLIEFKEAELIGSLLSTTERFEGYEAIIPDGPDGFYMTIESSHRGYLIRGRRERVDGRMRFIVDPSFVQPIPNRSGRHNMAEESLVWIDDQLNIIHEDNGTGIETPPRVHVWDGDSLRTKPMEPEIRRITDASTADSMGRFWAINYLWSEDDDRNIEKKGISRLLEFQGDSNRVWRTGRSIRLQPIHQIEANWEGLVRFRDGFLITNDKFPKPLGTVLFFIRPGK